MLINPMSFFFFFSFLRRKFNWFLAHTFMVYSFFRGLILPPPPTISPCSCGCLLTLTRVQEFLSIGWWNRWHYSLVSCSFSPNLRREYFEVGAKKKFWIACCSLPSSCISYSVIIFLSVVKAKIVTISSGSSVPYKSFIIMAPGG